MQIILEGEKAQPPLKALILRPKDLSRSEPFGLLSYFCILWQLKIEGMGNCWLLKETCEYCKLIL